MRSKRDRRPLATHESPILSDQMPLDPDEGYPSSEAIDNQLNDQGKKPTWKRLFGKGGGSKRKQDENSRPASDRGRDENNIEIPPTEYSYSSSLTKPQIPDKMQQDRAPAHSAINKNSSRTSYQSSGVSDKRDDTIESSQNLSNANKLVLDMNDKKNAPEPSSTKSQNTSRSRSRSRSFMRSIKKKSSQTLSSPSVAAKSPGVSQQIIGDDQKKNGATDSRSPGKNFSKQSPAKNFSKQSPGKNYSQPQKRKSSSSTPLSSASTKDTEGDIAKHDVKKILSKPFGREHILMTEQTVSARNNVSLFLVPCYISFPLILFYFFFAQSGSSMHLERNGIRKTPCGNIGSISKGARAANYRILQPVLLCVPWKTLLGWSSHCCLNSSEVYYFQIYQYIWAFLIFSNVNTR